MAGKRISGRFYTIGALIFCAVVLLDQITKAIVNKFLPAAGGYIPVCGFLNLVFVTNKGISFGLLNTGATWQLAIIYTAISLSCLWLVRTFLFASTVPQAAAPVLMLAGASGNILDRVIHGAVIDFIDFYVSEWSIPFTNTTIYDCHWPAFNFADAAVVCGGIMLFFITVRGK
ncbi:MAG: signal peptidase II [Holosporales bacterium]|jgi:signal peptidase II|nr:signal peptidase II [Holosporales bacterium]